MARSLEDIKAEINEAIANEPQLAGIDLNLSTSNVSIWKLWRNVVASAVLTIEKLFDSHKSEVRVLSERLIYGKEDWYQEQAFLWQYGDALSVIEGKPTYVPIDLTKRLITRCAVRTGLGSVSIKVAKGTASSLSALTNDEKMSFEFYIDRIKPAGIRTEVITQSADLLWPRLKVFYLGELQSGVLKDQVMSAMMDYLASIEFNGKFYLSRLIDAIQAVPGVVDVELIDVRVKSQVNPSFQFIDRMYEASSGYYSFDPDKPLTDQDQIQMIPQ